MIGLRSLGFFVIVIGILLFVVGGVIEYGITHSEKDKPIEEITNESIFASWLERFGQLFVFAGIGFILYDVAREGDDKLSHLRKRLKTE